METRFEPEQTRVEPRFHPDTVQKAVALAQRLQQERRETLGLGEIDQIAAEIGIDPSILRHALNAIAEKESLAAAEVRGQMNVHSAGVQQRQSKPVFALIVGGLSAGLLVPLFWLGARSAATPIVVPPQPPRVMEVPAEIVNGGFELGPGKSGRLASGSESIPGWTVAGGIVHYVKSPPAGGSSGALQLGEGGSVRQLFQTTPGQHYRLKIRVSGTPGHVNSMGRVRIMIGNVYAEATAFTPAKGLGVPKWSEGVLPFVAADEGTTVEITRQNGAGEDGTPIIDDVTVVPFDPRSPTMFQ